MAVKESFAAFTCTVMEMLVDDAPLIGSDSKAFQNKVNLLSVLKYSPDNVVSNMISLRDGW